MGVKHRKASILLLLLIVLMSFGLYGCTSKSEKAVMENYNTALNHVKNKKDCAIYFINHEGMRLLIQKQNDIYFVKNELHYKKDKNNYKIVKVENSNEYISILTDNDELNFDKIDKLYINIQLLFEELSASKNKFVADRNNLQGGYIVLENIKFSNKIYPNVKVTAAQESIDLIFSDDVQKIKPTDLSINLNFNKSIGDLYFSLFDFYTDMR